jgi:hypothetical protein
MGEGGGTGTKGKGQNGSLVLRKEMKSLLRNVGWEKSPLVLFKA